MIKYTPAKKIIKQMSGKDTTKKFELARKLLNSYTEQWTFVEYYEKFNAFYSVTKVKYVPFMSVLMPVELFDMEEV